MIVASQFVKILTEEGVDFFCGVPDSLLKSFCAYITDVCGGNHVITANEGGAVGIAAGHYLATGRPAVVYMQNSGQGNAVNPLISLADPDVYSIPMVLVVGWRGMPGVHDEPQHVKQGKVTISLFETLGIPTYVIPDTGNEEIGGGGRACECWERVVSGAVRQAVAEMRPVALIAMKGLFEEYKLKNKKEDLVDTPREEMIERILKEYGDEAVFVSTTGMISREVYETRERLGQGHDKDFLTVGSMGHASMIAMGIAKAKPNQLVICLDGDGAALMQMGNMAIVGQSGCENLLHIVLNNAAHDSVGGQPTVAGDVDLSAVAQACGYHVSSFMPGSRTSSSSGPTFMEIRVAKGARKDLGRPKESPQVNRVLFMKTLEHGVGHFVGIGEEY